MAKSNFLLVSLDEDESKKLAQVISNKTSRKILDLLSEKSGITETEISKKLKISISTIHYNLQQLVKANLITADEYHYSKKGREVLHYSLANKYVIIAPKKVSKSEFKEKLKRILPVATIIGLTGAIIHFVTHPFFGTVSSSAKTAALTESASASMIDQAVFSAGNEAIRTAPTIIEKVVYKSAPIALWFLAGAAFAIILYLLTDFIIKHSKKRK